MRGLKANNIILGIEPKEEDKVIPFYSTNKDKGRNIDLLKHRDTAMFYRYYYHIRIGKLKYNEVVEILVSEFFLAKETIGKKIVSDVDALSEIVKKERPLAILKNLYPFFNWDIYLNIDGKKAKALR